MFFKMVKTTNQLYVIHVYLFIQVPSGKRLHNYGKIHHAMGKSTISTISMAMFHSCFDITRG